MSVLVRGTVKMEYLIKLDGVEDIFDDTMAIVESDLLITNEINKLLPSGMNVVSDVFVSNISKIEEDGL